MKKKFYQNALAQEGAVFLLLSGGLLAYSLDSYNKSFNKDWAQSPSLFPVIASLMLALLGVILLVEGAAQQTPAAEKTKGRVKPVLAVIGMSIAYMLALGYIDLPYMGVTIASMTFVLSTFELATAAFLLAMMLYLGVRSRLALIAVPLGASAFLSIMFRTLLHVMLP